MNSSRKSITSTSRTKITKSGVRNKKSVTSDTVSDKKNQTTRLLTKAERELIAEYRRHQHALFPTRRKGKSAA